MTAAPEILRDANAHTLLVFKVGTVHLHCLALYEPPVRVMKLEKHERRYLTPLTYKGAPYPLKRALRHFKRAGKELGITDAAREAIAELRASLS